mgnify:FL=1|jgi:hypothetical protein
MNDIDTLFKDIAAILKVMQDTDKNLSNRIDRMEKELIPFIGRRVLDPDDNVGSETGIEDSKEYR